MRIACLGWGSLVWDPRDLPVRGPWHADGPLLPIEFARESDDGRLTLVLVPGRPLVRSCWALMQSDSTEDARSALGLREGVPAEHQGRDIGLWTSDSHPEGEIAREIDRWARGLGLDAAVWTALPFGMRNQRGTVPSIEATLGYLRGLENPAAKNAELYIRLAPHSVDTDVRRAVAAEFGWTPLSPVAGQQRR